MTSCGGNPLDRTSRQALTTPHSLLATLSCPCESYARWKGAAKGTLRGLCKFESLCSPSGFAPRREWPKMGPTNPDAHTRSKTSRQPLILLGHTLVGDTLVVHSDEAASQSQPLKATAANTPVPAAQRDSPSPNITASRFPAPATRVQHNISLFMSSAKFAPHHTFGTISKLSEHTHIHQFCYFS